jgi:putrescine transport system substrate-binding protein
VRSSLLPQEFTIVHVTRRSAAIALACTLLAGCGKSPAPASGSSSAAPAAPLATERVVNVYNWSDYMDPAVVAEFTKATGIKVNYDTFDSQEMLETKLLAGQSGFDVVIVSSDKLGRLAPVGTFMKLDYSQLPASKNIDPDVRKALATFDAGNEHAIGYVWGTTGVGYDARMLQELAPGAANDSWQLVFDPRNAKRMAGCGVSVIDAPSEVIASALVALGRNPNEITPDSIAQATKLLAGMRASVRKIDSDTQIGDMAEGNACLLVTWGTNVGLARARATDAGKDIDFRYVIPREGAIGWYDSFAIPADAPHAAEAHAFINFMQDPAIAARNSNYAGVATANGAALPLVDAALRDDTSIYPTAEVRARVIALRPRNQDESRLETRAWADFRNGATP